MAADFMAAEHMEDMVDDAEVTAVALQDMAAGMVVIDERQEGSTTPDRATKLDGASAPF